MSSIFGRINFDGAPVADVIATMRARLDHWKADRVGEYVSNNVGMGQLMLFNTLSSQYEQLPQHKDGLVITADICLHNRAEICKRLDLTDEETQHTDSALVLMLYRAYGADCVKYLIGDFAFAIWDEAKQTLFCARDHMGVKPFFYTHNAKYFAFATEKKGLLVMPDMDKALNESYLYNQLIRPASQLPHTTLYKHIHRLEAAHSLQIENGRISIQRYWSLDCETEIKLGSVNEYYEGLHHHFDEAIKCRLRSAYEVGSELSGGLDSTAIVGAAMKFAPNGISTFSNTLAAHITDEKMLSQSERQYIEAAIKYFDVKRATLITEDIWNNPLDEADFAMDVNDGLEYWNPLWQIAMKKAAMERGVRTLLSGFPGDEMVTYKGHHHYMHLLDTKQYSKYFGQMTTKRELLLRLPALVPYSVSYAMHKLSNLLSINDKKMRLTSSAFQIPLKYKLQRNDAIWGGAAFKDRFRSYRHFLANRLQIAHVQLRMESETRYGIYFRMEPRFPMADIRLTQFYLSMPNELRHNESIDRHTYRQAVKEYLPPEVFTRVKKTGNMAPFLVNEEKGEEKRKAAKDILQLINKDLQLPLNINIKKSMNYAPLDVVRWLQKMPYLK